MATGRLDLRVALAAFLSGCAALAYEVLWTRELGLILGHGAAAVATVLATFMAGLGLGGALAAHRVDRVPEARRGWWFARLELGIAACGMAFLLSRELAYPLAAVLQHRGESAPALLAAVRLAIAAGLLLLPTTLMGATLPALAARLAPSPAQTGSSAGWLYAANAAGAVTGSLATPLFVLPALGVWGATTSAASLNLAAALTVLTAQATHTSAESSPQAAQRRSLVARPKDGLLGNTAIGRVAAVGPYENREPTDGRSSAVVLAVVALSGTAALADEVAWTRVLALLIGPTVYAFAFIVAAVIAGLTLGSAAAAAWTRRHRPTLSSLAAMQFVAAFASLWIVHRVAEMPFRVGEMVRQNADRIDRLLGLELAGTFLVLLPPCLCLGAAFPLAVGVLAQRRAGAGRAVGRTYAWNTAGAVAGALVAGFVALPRWGSRHTLLAAATLHALAGLAAFVTARPTARRLAVAAAGAIAFGLVLAGTSRWDPELLAGGAYKYAAYRTSIPPEDELRAGELAYFREGALATVSVRRLGAKLSLAVDGKVDATSGGDMLTQRLLAHVPLLLHPAPRRVGVIGLGSGVTVGSVLTHPVDHVDVVEISPEVVEASALFRHVNHDPLADPRVRLRLGDARNVFLVTPERYDVVISEPSNPWMAGVASLFTRDFFSLARRRLAPGGLFCQWTHIYNMEREDVRAIVGGFVDVFPEAALYLVNEGDLLLVGGNGPQPAPHPEVLTHRLAQASIRSDLEAVGLRSPYGFARLFALQTPALGAWVAGAPRHTDDRPILELRAARALHADTAGGNRAAIEEAARRSTPPAWVVALTAGARPQDVAERGSMLEKAESYTWAFDTYRGTVALDPGQRDAAEGLVRTALRLERVEAAEQTLQRIAAESDAPAARTALALLYRDLGRNREALAQLEAASRRAPRDLGILLLGAEVQSATGNVESMAGLAEAALSLAPGDTDSRALLAEARLQAGRIDEAAALAGGVLAEKPGHQRAREVAAIAAAMQKDRPAARGHFTALVAAAPDAWSYLNNFGTFEMESGDPAAAARLFERAVDLNPSNETGYRGLREAAAALGDASLVQRAERGLARLGVR